jgi:ArsR family transcriptional regulator, arsenate/arsenite/antimonite-responsive transcriptional repressor
LTNQPAEPGDDSRLIEASETDEALHSIENEDAVISALEYPEVAPTGLSDDLEKELVQVFKLLSDETRLRVLLYLVREGELHVTALCERLKQSQPAVSHHLALLRVAGVIEARRDGKHNFYSVRREHFDRIMGELFSSMTQEGETIRFNDFVVTHEGLE